MHRACVQPRPALVDRPSSRWLRLGAAALLMPLALTVAADPARAGRTPVGAETAGNAAGTIPAWTGGLRAPPAGWQPTQGYVDPFADEKPLYTVDAANLSQ